MNPREGRLVPRLPRLDRYLIPVSHRRLVRGLEYRALMATRDLRYRALFAAANRRYGHMLTFEASQVRFFDGTVVVDHDEPDFSPAEVELLNRPNVAAVVVTTDIAAAQLRDAGLDKPIEIIPPGVDLATLSDEAVSAVAAEHRRNGELVFGYISAGFLTRADRGHNDSYDADDVLELWDGIRERVPGSRLWLIGEASERVRRACAERGDVLLFEDIPYGGAMPYVANFDIGLYPRRRREMALPAKLVEYMGAGVPIVSYDFDHAAPAKAGGAGVFVREPREFVSAAESLARDGSERSRMAEAGRATGVGFDWSRLIRRYEVEILDRYLS
jgi:glycosyltransferase involved in cell wall biosynthesis